SPWLGSSRSSQNRWPRSSRARTSGTVGSCGWPSTLIRWPFMATYSSLPSGFGGDTGPEALSASAGRGPVDPSQRRDRGRWLPTGREPGEEPRGGRGDRSDRFFESLVRGRRGLLHPAHLADVLAGGGLDLLRAGGRLQASESGDVPAHGVDSSGYARGPRP